jgi:hypothetical protein
MNIKIKDIPFLSVEQFISLTQGMYAPVRDAIERLILNVQES